MRIPIRFLIAFALALATSSLYAITYIVPTDRDLVRRSDAIVIATALESHAQLGAKGRIVTVTTFAVQRSLKGVVDETIHVTEPGGTVGGMSTMLPGSPRYDSGKRYIVFLIRNVLGEWTTYGFGLGKFEWIEDLHGKGVLTRGSVEDSIFGFEEGAWALHTERLRGGPEFASFVEAVAGNDGAITRNDYFIDRSEVVFATFPEFRAKVTAFVPHIESTRPDYLMAGNFRWQSATVTIDYCCTSKGLQPGLDGPGAVAVATANWRSAGPGINYTAGTNNEGATGGVEGLGRGLHDGFSAVLFNDPFNDFAASGVPPGVVGIGGISRTGPAYSTLGDGFTYNATTEGDVVIAKAATLSGVNQNTFNLVLTHELGHTLGFRHSDGTSDPQSPTTPGHQFSCQAPSPCAAIGQAVMASTISSNLGGLQQWDTDAAQTVYGSGPVCNAPAITTQPAASQSITSGNQASLTVAASGSAPLTYQWYIGNSGTTTTPVNGATSTTFHPSPTTTTSYWARVTGCNSLFANSNTAVVTVTCAPPSAPAPLASPSSIPFGQSSTITVSPTGTGPFTYQWFTGNSGNISGLIGGASSSSITVSPTTATAYWVRVTGQCGSPADSPATIVTVTCMPIASGSPSALPSTISAGQSSTLTVTTAGNGPFTYQWFAGNLGDLSNLIGGATGTSTVVSPTTTSSFWVRVNAPCGVQDANVLVVVNGSVCNAALITTQPASATISTGASVTLTVGASGTAPLTYQWYIGDKGDTSNLISGATTFSLTRSPTVTTKYWVRVSGCNNSTADSNAATVTVSSCASPSIITQPANVSDAIGTAATLKVVAGGTGLHYQWYQGAKGDTSKTAGTDSATLVTGAISGNTTYWVRVSGTCGKPADSNTALVTALAPPRARAVRH